MDGSANSLSHACWLLFYPLAGWLGTRYGMPVTFAVLGGAGALAVWVAFRVWPAQDPEVIEHEPETISRDGAREWAIELEGDEEALADRGITLEMLGWTKAELAELPGIVAGLAGGRVETAIGLRAAPDAPGAVAIEREASDGDVVVAKRCNYRRAAGAEHLGHCQVGVRRNAG